MRRECIVVVSIVLALAEPCAAADTPTVRPLDPGSDSAPPAGAEEPARTLPPTVAICHEPGGSRCWTRPLAEECVRDGGQVFRVVLGEADGRDATAALRQCRLAAESPRRDRPSPEPR
jgi:hypothetical protein